MRSDLGGWEQTVHVCIIILAAEEKGTRIQIAQDFLGRGR